MSSFRILDWLGSAALTIAVVSLLFLFLPGIVRAEPAQGSTWHCVSPAALEGGKICEMIV
ncbi:MAG TPA: hypothetical protein VM553_06060 [Dongiaceae bacterium]|nr:hypothetical protein [Dongiaceae bacterium]